ncbi:ABC transporter permease [Kitasatospora sp. NPDC018619]|uniref:ABC transporter permease n=1 Tax=unclassified Kitasatospora TaxID=2633591 RepID=UPI0037A0F5F5
MTTAPPAHAAAAGAGPRPPRSDRFRLRGPAWLAWRQSRAAARTYGAVLLLAVLASLAVHWRLGGLFEAQAQARARPECDLADSWRLAACRDPYLDGMFLASWYTRVARPVMFALPLVVGMSLGAPLLAEEYERGTLRLVRAQSVSPARWLRARLLAPALLVLCAVGPLSAVVSWIWYEDLHRHWNRFDSPFAGLAYASVGAAPLAWSLFALAVGLALGALLRRTVAAVLATGALVLLTQGLFRYARVHFLPLETATQPASGLRNPAGFDPPPGAWLVGQGAQLPDGTRLTEGQCLADSSPCAGATTAWGRYHPVSQFVPMQLVEAGLLLALAAGLVWFVFRRVARSAG